MSEHEPAATAATAQKRRARAPAGWQPRFLEVLADTGSVRVAARAASVHRASVYRERHRSAGFRAQWDAAIADAGDLLEAIAWQRAQEYSDPLLMFLLKGLRPEKYRERHQIDIEEALRERATALGLDPAEVLAEAAALLTAARAHPRPHSPHSEETT